MMLWWIEVSLLVVLVPVAAWQGAVALHSLKVKLREEKEGGFSGHN